MGDEANHAMKPASPEQVLYAEALQCATPDARADGQPYFSLGGIGASHVHETSSPN